MIRLTTDIAEYHGVKTDQDGWKHHAWTVEITARNDATSQTATMRGIQYKTGTGLVDDDGTPTPPATVDVVHAVAMDSDALNMGFVEWAEEYGFDTDSRKAEAMYRRCADMGRDLRHTLHLAGVVGLGAAMVALRTVGDVDEIDWHNQSEPMWTVDVGPRGEWIDLERRTLKEGE